MRAASETTWSKAGWMKSANWISATGSSPCSAIPIAMPTIPDSASGVSITRSSPNSVHQPVGDPEHAAPRADVLAEQHDPLVVLPSRRGARPGPR